ncbi:hypothetical protein [Agrobacterium tumefaciens]|uniref:hypothetical protein n=1 Tax=Agrobacterium tumefaciens TaxID=358 RepID=UPI001E2E9EB4|nr:hypothetical protein [Agrobacterium tumefaciens]
MDIHVGEMHANHEYESSGIFLNDDINIVKAVVSSEEGPALCRADVARYVLKMYDRGLVDLSKLQQMAALYFRNKIACTVTSRSYAWQLALVSSSISPTRTLLRVSLDPARRYAGMRTGTNPGKYGSGRSTELIPTRCNMTTKTLPVPEDKHSHHDHRQDR